MKGTCRRRGKAKQNHTKMVTSKSSDGARSEQDVQDGEEELNRFVDAMSVVGKPVRTRSVEAHAPPAPPAAARNSYQPLQ